MASPSSANSTFTNNGTIAPAGILGLPQIGARHYGSFGNQAAGTIINTGAIYGGVSVGYFVSPGFYPTYGDRIINTGRITGNSSFPAALHMAGSSVTNSGAGFIGGIHGLAGTPLILNGATIAAPDFSDPGIQLDQGGGQVANSDTGTITALNNVGILSYGQTAIVNRGAIAALGTGSGIQLGRPAGSPAGPPMPAPIGAIANYGTISGIVGISVLSPFAATRIVDAGAIVGSGGTAVSFASGTPLVLEAGYSLQGAVAGGAGTTNTIELDGTNGLASLVTVDFNSITLINVPTVAFGPGNYIRDIADHQSRGPAGTDRRVHRVQRRDRLRRAARREIRRYGFIRRGNENPDRQRRERLGRAAARRRGLHRHLLGGARRRQWRHRGAPQPRHAAGHCADPGRRLRQRYQGRQHYPCRDAGNRRVGVAGDTVLLYEGATLVGMTMVASGGAWSIATGPLADGPHTFRTKQVDVVGDVGPLSDGLTITIKTSAPAPAALTLSPASDSGLKGDNVTNVVMPVITGSGEAGDTLLLFDGTTLVGMTVVAADGGWSVTSTALGSGVHIFTAQELDLANNTGPFSTPLTITIETSAPAPTALTLSPASDSGVKGDNITNVVMPVITGSGEAGDTLLLFDGTTLVGMTVAADGGWSVTSTALGERHPYFHAQELDLANNASPFSMPLTITIKTSAPAPAAFTLSPTSDSGVKGDTITSSRCRSSPAPARPATRPTIRRHHVGRHDRSRRRWRLVGDEHSLTSGIHTFTAQELDLANNASPFSAPLTIAIKTSAPAPAALTLSAMSDSGVKGDNVTNVVMPVITGSGEAGDTLLLFDGTTLVGMDQSQPMAAGSVSNTLASGTHTFTAQEPTSPTTPARSRPD